MSQPFSRYLHPFDVAGRPDLEPEVKRAILASWASDHFAASGKPALGRPLWAAREIAIDDMFDALRSLDGQRCTNEPVRR